MRVSLDENAPGFLKWGRLEYVGGHYLKFRDGPYYLKGGTDSPENFLGYKGFDNTFDQPGGAGTSGLENGLHRYQSHVADFGPDGLGDEDDPLFVSEDTGYDSKGIIGLLNYLSSQNVNSIYFLTMNLEGDGCETYPFVGPSGDVFDKTHFDISKLRQWNMVFEHATRRGIKLHFVLGETENDGYFDNMAWGTERKLYYRELIARFGHALAIKWNLGEECDDICAAGRDFFADYIRAQDPDEHPISFHTNMMHASGAYASYQQSLGDDRYSTATIQNLDEDAGNHVEIWRAASAASGQP